MYRELPVWRSLMYVPVNVEKYVDKAHTRGADVIQLDVEDSVPLAEKPQMPQKNSVPSNKPSDCGRSSGISRGERWYAVEVHSPRKRCSPMTRPVRSNAFTPT